MENREVWRGGNMLYPVPAVMVSCSRPGEKPNIITVAWAGTICSSPAMVSISVRPGRYSYAILKDTGEFVINLTTRKLIRAADFCGVHSGRDTDKFEACSLTAVPASKLNTVLIGESPVNIECRVKQIVELGSHHMFIAEAVAVDVDPQFLDASGRLDLRRADLAVYSHGEYFALGDRLGTFGFSVRKRKNGSREGNKGGSKEGNKDRSKEGNRGGSKDGNKGRNTGENKAGSRR